MAYGIFLNNINREFQAQFQNIEAGHNFDYGIEFEIALCAVLRLAMPSKFGICRGFIVTSDGDEAGDDIIIFDRERFPALRLFEDQYFIKKQRIPVEAVYAYIEAKHTLYVADNGGQSLSKACNEIAQVKALSRPRVPLNTLVPGVRTEYEVKRDKDWPDFRNPLFCAIISRNVSWKPKQKKVSMDKVISQLESFTDELSQGQKDVPDMILAGSDIVCLPTINQEIKSPFFIPDSSQLTVQPVRGTGFGIGVSMLSWALDSILLGTIDWSKLLYEGLDIPIED